MYTISKCLQNSKRYILPRCYQNGSNSDILQLVGFIASPSPQIRAVAIENLVPYSTTDPSIFKINQLAPVKNLKVLVQDRPVRDMLPSFLIGA